MEYIYLSFAYLVGSIPFGLIVTKILTGKNITKEGSGNIGATNVFRIVSKKIGTMVLLLDALKPVMALILINNYDHTFFNNYKVAIIFFAVIGHIYPIWLRFKGGKGIAVYLGILFAFSLNLGFIFVISWVVILYITKYSSLSSLISSLIILLYSITLNNFSISLFIFIIFIVVIYTHKENISRIKDKTENKTNF